MNRFYLIVLMTIMNSWSYSQINFDDCLPEFTEYNPKSGGNVCSDNMPNNSSSLFRNKYAQMEHWIPNEDDEKLIVRIAFHIFNDNHGDGTNYPDNQQTRDDILQMVTWVNSFYNNCNPSNPLQGVEDVDFTKIEFDIQDRMYFYKNDALNGNCNPYMKLNFIHQDYPERIMYLPILISGECEQFASLPYPDFIPETGGGTSLDLEGDLYVVMSGIGWGGSQTLGHELGHTLDLKHTYEISCCHESCDHYSFDYLWDVFGTSVNSQCWHDGGWGCDIDDNNNTCTNNMMGGVNTTCHYFSPLQVGKMQRSLAIKSVRKYVDPKSKVNRPYHITTTENWDFDIRMHRDLIIDEGSELTVSCRIRMGDSCKIIVMPGGKLYIDGGIITNALYSDDYWQGIQVYGTSDKNQFPEINPTYQGLLIIKNGGIIENAHLAVSNWKVDDFDAIGGVIQATDAVFRNNRRDVAFMSYQNYNQNYTNKYRNLSKFTNTDFITDDNFFEKGLAIQTHVTMWQVDGIIFTNCHFSNDITVNKNNSSSPNRGIYSIDAGYKVLAGCTTTQPIGQQCPTANLLKSSFSGLGTAVEATGASTTETVVIQQADFEDNVWGVVIDELDNVSVNRNAIEVGDASYTLLWPLGAGVMVDNSTGYIVEENEITTNLSGGMRVGINVSNSGTDDNEIYKNKLNTLDVGVAGNGLNHDNNYQKGLQFLCNDFLGNGTAISINSSPINDGVRFYQGNFSPLKSAGNIFMTNTLDIDNSANSIVYIHNGGNTEPINYQGMITFQDTLIANSCPTSFGGGIIFGPVLLALDSLNTQFNSLKTSYNDLNFTYISLIDDGNTEDFKDNIEINWSNDAWLLRGKLLENSPYLSSDVLLEAAKQNILPNGMLLEILLANPDATRGERFVEALKEATQNTFPEYMLDYIRGNYDRKTLRTDMEGQLSSIHSELSSTRNWIKHLTKSKEEYDDSNKFDIVKMGDEIYNKVGLMDYYIEQGNFSQADSVLNVIENDKKYKEDLELINNFGDYIAFRASLGNRSLAQLDSTEISYLETLAENKGRVAGYARNILCFFYDICYEKNLEFGEPQAKSMMIPNQNNKEGLNNVLYNVKVYPNPAKDYTSLQWEIYDELKNARYSVVDLNGRELLNGVLSDNKGEQVIDTRKLGQGVYIIGIYNNNQLKVNKKLVIESQR